MLVLSRQRDEEGQAMKILSLEAVTRAVAVFYGVNVQAVRGRSRLAHFVLPRQVAAYLARQFTMASYQGIGRYLNRDHTSVIYFVRHVEDLMTHDRGLAEQVDFLTREFERRAAAHLDAQVKASDWVIEKLRCMGLMEEAAAVEAKVGERKLACV